MEFLETTWFTRWIADAMEDDDYREFQNHLAQNPMKKEAFEELCEAVREGGRILRGEQKPSRSFTVTPVNIRRTRSRLHLSQARFAGLIGVPPATLLNWEQGRTYPDGPARALLTVVSREPEAVLRALHPDVK